METFFTIMLILVTVALLCLIFVATIKGVKDKNKYIF